MALPGIELLKSNPGEAKNCRLKADLAHALLGTFSKGPSAETRDRQHERARYNKSFTEDELLDLFPEGLRTPAALFARLQVECQFGVSSPITASRLTAFVLDNRDAPEFQASKGGHCRRVMMAFIGIAAAACSDRCLRDLSPEMVRMIESTYMSRWRAQLVFLLTKSCLVDSGRKRTIAQKEKKSERQENA